MATINSISQQLLDLLATRNFHPEMLDKLGKPSDAADAKTFTFDYVSGTGKNYGTMVIVLDSDNDMKVMYGDNLGRTMEGDDKQEFFDFIQHLNQKAKSNRWTHSIADISQLKHTMQGMAAIQEGLFEGYYGTRKVSYAGEPTQARLQIVHSQPLGENDARYRHIDKMFIETVDGERFKLGFKSLSGARAMLEHVRQGGKPYDIRGCHITETVSEIAVLSRFNRASANRILEGVTQELVTEAQQYYQSLRENLKHMGTSRGYSKYFESWHPATISEQEGVVDNIKTLFIEQSIDSRIEAALPLLAKIQQRGQEMKEADIFESWINNLGEGTWTLPETPEQLDKLKTLMTKELIVGPDATNATEQLYELVGDDVLFDRLQALADQDPRANAWNDTEVMNRLAELGVEMPEPSAPGNPAEPQTGATAPVDAGVAPNPAPQLPVAEGDNLSTFESINAMRRAAGLPVVEGVLTDSTGSTLDHICNRFGKEVRDFEESGDMSEDLYHALYDYYFDDMPYGTKKARDGDPYEWIADRFSQDRGLSENLIAPMAMPVATEGAGCNMTAEGEYCPEHGLTECGMGMPANIMGESQLDEGVMDSLKGFVAKLQALPMIQKNLAAAKAKLPQIIAAAQKSQNGKDLMANLGIDEQQAQVAEGLGKTIAWGSYAGAGASLIAIVADFAMRAYISMGKPSFEEMSSYQASGFLLLAGFAAVGAGAIALGTSKALDSMKRDNMDENVFDKPKHDDPINYNAAITGNYYESKEGDAVLARIKSLALLK